MRKLIEIGETYEIVQSFPSKTGRILEAQTIPLYSIEAFASIVSLFVGNFVPSTEIRIPDSGPCDGGLYVTGDSMYPVIFDGDLVTFELTNSRKANLFFGEIYLLAFDLDGCEYIAVKYLYRSEVPGHYRLVSHNTDHKPKDIPIDSVRVLARVTNIIRHKNLY